MGLVFSGRSAALFAVLAGIGLALTTGKQEPRQGTDLWAARSGVAMRALVIAVVGLTLGGLDVNIAVIPCTMPSCSFASCRFWDCG